MPSHPYKDIANHLASKGRYGDTELLHVNRAELRGLAAAMPGGKLTINPHTGKPEAFLPFLLPLLGGLAGSAFLPGAVAAMGLGTLGTTMAGAIGSGAVAAGLGLAEGNDIGTAAGKGLLSGLGSYGLGSAMEGLASGTGATATEAAEAAAKEAAKESATAGIGAANPAGAGSPLDNFIASGNAGVSAEAGGPAYADIGGLLDSGTTGASIGAGGNLNVPDPSVFGDFGNKLSNAGTNYMNTAKDAAGNLLNPKALWGTFGENSGRTLLPMGLSIAGQGMFDQKPPPQMPVEPTYPAASTLGTGRQYAEAPSSYRPGRDPEWSYFRGGYRDGGQVDRFSDLRDTTARRPLNVRGLIDSGAIRVTQPGNGRGGVDVSDDPESWSLVSKYNDERGDTSSWENKPSSYESAFRSLNEPGPLYDGKYDQIMWSADRLGLPDRDVYADTVNYADGGPISRAISGPGNGLDDSIPAIIDGRVPASLSSGEHVIPAAVVSALGNGSTEEGSRQLEAMTDRILKKKFGTKNRTPRPLNPAKMLVA